MSAPSGEMLDDDLFAASLAHEFKKPLAAVHAALESLRRNLGSFLQADPSFTPSDPETGRAMRDLCALISRSLEEPVRLGSLTGLEGERRIKAVMARLSKPEPDAARVIVHGGWEDHVEEIARLLSTSYRSEALRLLDAVGKIRFNLASIQRSVDKLIGVTESLRSGFGGAGGERGMMRLRPCLETALEDVRREAPAGAELELRCDERLSLEADPGQIRIVVTNLAGNALASAPPQGGRVVVEAARDSGGVLLSVTDNGPGIHESVQPKVFTPFFTTRSRGAGSGLGLFIARKIAESYGGTLTFTSSPGSTRFEARFPSSAEAG